MLLTALEDVPPDVVGWMPSHLTIKDLNFQMATKSDESLVGRLDLEGNKLAGELAKRGVEFHRATPSDVTIWTVHIERAKTRAMWIGIATAEAKDFASFPFKDSEAARWRADAAQRAKKNAKNGIDGRRRKVPLGRKLAISMCNGGTMLSKLPLVRTGCVPYAAEDPPRSGD